MQNIIEEISKILWANEKRLSDGYEFYEGGYEEAVQAVNEISQEIARLLTSRAVDEGDSAPLQAESTPEHLPIEEADTTPALRN